MNVGWMSQAECRGMDMNLFFPPRGAQFKADAVKVCRRCPVSEQCLDYGMKKATGSGDNYGMFGGLTPLQRYDLKKQAGRQRVA